MCRLFGFRSVIPSQVHTSLVRAENALMIQSHEHPDGWGVAYYQGGCPHLVKSAKTAIDDSLFQKISGIVSSETVLAHLRKATSGELSLLNTHPFQYGKWVFAHNGNIENFAACKTLIQAEIAPRFRRFALGQTDSELLFLLILTRLERYCDVHVDDIPVEQVFTACQEALAFICEQVEPLGPEDGDSSKTYLSLLMTNGHTMVGHHGGQTLSFSTHKTLCSQRNHCPFLSESCERATWSGQVNHLILSSEQLAGENVWQKMKRGEFVGVDRRMQLKRAHFDYSPFVCS